MKDFIIVLLVMTVAVVGLIGWVKNIIILIATDSITGFTLVRALGVFMFPLGCVLGWL